MSVQVVDRFHQPFVSPETSGDGVLQRVCDRVIHISGALTIQESTSAVLLNLWNGALATAEQTNSGLVELNTTTTPHQEDIAELRRRSGLTWDQLARLFGVSRRSVHFWASGQGLNAANEERLGRMLAVIRHIDRGSAQANRAALTAAQNDGVIPFDLLTEGNFDEVMDRLGSGASRPMADLASISADALEARMPPSPDKLVGALQDSVHREVGKYRIARTNKSKSKSKQ